jgi:hypothetical protein
MSTPDTVAALRRELGNIDASLDVIDGLGDSITADAEGTDNAARNVTRTGIKDAIATFVTNRRADLAAVRGYIDNKF